MRGPFFRAGSIAILAATVAGSTPAQAQRRPASPDDDAAGAAVGAAILGGVVGGLLAAGSHGHKAGVEVVRGAGRGLAGEPVDLDGGKGGGKGKGGGHGGKHRLPGAH